MKPAPIIWQLIFVVTFVFLSVPLHSQVTHPDWERYLEQTEEDADRSQLLEQLGDWRQHPLNLNQASAEELLQIPGFPEQSVNAILKYRKKHNVLSSLTTVKELLQVDEELWQWLSQFITVRSIERPVKWRSDYRLRVYRPIELVRGYQENVYRSNPYKIYQRYRAQLPADLRLGVLLEKDGGESRFDDHLVFSLEKNWQRFHSQLVLGHYTINLGLGLMLWSPLAVRKGSDPFYSLQRNDRVIRPYLSAFESRYCQGAAFVSSPGRWRFAGWFSQAPADASISPTGEIVSFDETGLHRTTTELAKRNRAAVRLQGGMAGYELPIGCRFQLTALQAEFTPAIAPKTTEPVNWQVFGKKIQVYGFTLRSEFGRTSFFCEAAWQNQNAAALLAGFAADWPQTRLSLLYRTYSPKYNNPFAQGFGEWTNTRNETGWYLVWQFSPFARTKWLLAADQFAMLWRSTDQPLPPRGAEIYLQWEQRINHNFHFYLRYTSDQKPYWITTGLISPLERKLILPGQTERLRCHFQILLAKNFELSGRSETIRYSLQPEFHPNVKSQRQWGWILYWDLRCRTSTRFTASTRLAFFDTQSYPARSYQFEQDVPGVLNSRLLYGQGIRFYFLVHWQVCRWLKISTKYAGTRYEDRETIGSGWDTLVSPAEHTLSLQLDGEF